MNMEVNDPYLSKVFLELIQMNATFQADLQAAMPAIYADIQSFKNNPNCSCRSKIEAHINATRNASFAYLDEWLKKHSMADADVQALIQKYVVSDVAGRIFRIPKTDAAFLEFKQRAINDRFTYRSMCIVPEEHNIAIYFL